MREVHHGGVKVFVKSMYLTKQNYQDEKDNPTTYHQVYLGKPRTHLISKCKIKENKLWLSKLSSYITGLTSYLPCCQFLLSVMQHWCCTITTKYHKLPSKYLSLFSNQLLPQQQSTCSGYVVFELTYQRVRL